jgi:putative salt-induced outer membrane protein
VGTTGNASTQTIGLNGEFIVRPEHWVITNKASFIRNESESELTAQSFGYLFRAARALSPRLSAFGEYAYFRDEFAGVANRNSLVGGVSYKLVDLPKHVFFTDAGIGYMNEQRLKGDDVSSATWSLGAGYRWKISETAEFTEDFRMTGLFTDAADWRVLQAAAITARLTQLFSLKVSNTIRYAHAPVPGFKDTDTNTSVALVAKF